MLWLLLFSVMYNVSIKNFRVIEQLTLLKITIN